ncbi:hypothetical protein [Paenibacillus sp. USHLN196]|uniref:hypothetical protein n=1 Tax=Paenibacillus sp. USHLN196 TaxID=3081291 RepID=UPI00301588FA
MKQNQIGSEEMFRVMRDYIEGDTLTLYVECVTDLLLKYDLVIQIDKTQKRYSVIDNPYPENENRIQNLGIESDEVELDLQECIRGKLDAILTAENLTEEFKYAEYIYSIKQWLDDGESLY